MLFIHFVAIIRGGFFFHFFEICKAYIYLCPLKKIIIIHLGMVDNPHMNIRLGDEPCGCVTICCITYILHLIEKLPKGFHNKGSFALYHYKCNGINNFH